MQTQKLCCPKCKSEDVTVAWANAKDQDFGAGFVECGEFDGREYELETNIDLFTCRGCGCRFAVEV